MITKEQTVGEILARHPGTQEVMLRHGLPCIGCHVNPHESLEKATQVLGWPAEKTEALLADLNQPAVLADAPHAADASVELSEFAAEKIKKIMEAEGKAGQGLRVSAVPGGCSGYSYQMEFEPAPTGEDQVSEQHGLKVFFAKGQGALLDGIFIDYRESLQGSGFVMKNPNAKSSCGCGQSFGT
jgi:iron-sulfur cluster insertion protein